MLRTGLHSLRGPIQVPSLPVGVVYFQQVITYGWPDLLRSVRSIPDLVLIIRLVLEVMLLQKDGVQAERLERLHISLRPLSI